MGTRRWIFSGARLSCCTRSFLSRRYGPPSPCGNATRVIEAGRELFRGVVEARLQIEIAGSLRFQFRDRAFDAGQVCRVIGFNEEVAKIDVSGLEIDLADADRFLGSGSGWRCSGRFLRRFVFRRRLALFVVRLCR